MNSGSLVEYASPYELLQNPKSSVSSRRLPSTLLSLSEVQLTLLLFIRQFYLLCKATGKFEFASLVKLAEEKERCRGGKKTGVLV